MKEPLVSVCMITYNHEAYITQAINGFLMQETNFNCELVIGEDCSTDNTRNIVMEFHEKYPDQIRPLLAKENMGGRKNFVTTLSACRGKYVAVLDGDDYWTDPYKLQKQVDFLEAHPDYTICFHSVMIISEDGNHEPILYYPLGRKDTYHIEDLFEQNFIAACSTFFRRGLFGDFPAWFYLTPVGDWSLHMLNAQHGKIGYIDECMGTYRRHSGAVYSPRSPAEKLKINIDQLKIFRDAFGGRYRDLVDAGLCKYHYSLAIQYFDDGNFQQARTQTRKCIVKSPHNRYVAVSKLLKMVVKVHFPRFWRWCKRTYQRGTDIG